MAILCGEAAAHARGNDDLRVILSGAKRTFGLEIEQISQAVGAEIPARLVDLLEIAAYVFAADLSISRGGDKRRDWGADWRRQMRFTIPVRDAAFWQRQQVVAALVDALSFLSDDIYTFDFVRLNTPTPVQSYLFGPADRGAPHAPDDVVLFSGGADSLAGAIETLATSDRRVALVSHRSSQKVLTYQRQLASALQTKFPGRVIPIRVLGTRIKGKRDAEEDTQRSRTFLYTALGFVIGRLFGVDRIQLCENGVVSINLPISEQLVGAMATRTTHPYAMHLLTDLLSFVADERIDLKNPFIWMTKAEVLQSLKRNGGADLLRESVSCSNIWKVAREKPHCGRCSQCLDRRFAVLAAGMEQDDPESMYVTDLFRGARENDKDTTMAVDFCRHAVKLSKMTDAQLFTEYADDLGQVRDAFPDCTADAIAEKCFRLFARHGQEVSSVLADAVRRSDEALARHDLPPSCLLRLHLAGRFDQQPISTAEPEAFSIDPGAERPEAPPTIFPLQLAIDDERRLAEVLNVTTFSGRAFDLLHVLAVKLREDVDAGRRLDDCRYSPADDLATALSTDVESVRQIISRQIRGEMREVLSSLGEPTDDDLLVQTSEGRRGYRLNPLVRLVAPSVA